MMKNRLLTQWLSLSLLLSTLVVFVQQTAASEAEAEDAMEYLEIYKEFDGKCQGLRRGDIRMLRNTHPDKKIQFRMVRLLGGHRQASLIQDIIAPGEDNAQRLGCETLDDREQVWNIVRAEYIE